MKHFFSISDVDSLGELVNEALNIKAHPFAKENLGKRKTLGLVFLNPSLRTRMSTQKAAAHLGMQVMVMNVNHDGWALETADGIVMNGSAVEHLREAAAVMGVYCDVLGLRSFPSLKDVEADYSEDLFGKFQQFCAKPVVSLESATRHPLQSLADLITIVEQSDLKYEKHLKQYVAQGKKPKVVLTWAPHVKALPQAVPNSFSEWMCAAQKEQWIDFVIAHPKGYELKSEFTQGATIMHKQEEALEGADFIYVKNWSAYQPYAAVLEVEEDWMLDSHKLGASPEAKVMHCLPVRRDLELAASILDGPKALVLEQAANRVWAAQVVLQAILEKENS